jgi:TRAP-type transport system periplasmic protein
VLGMLAAACGTPGDDEAAPVDTTPDPADEAEVDPVDDDDEAADEVADDGETVQLTYASHIPPGGVIEYGTEWFIEELESRSNGRVQVESFFGGALLGGAELYRGVQDGVVDFGHISQGRVHTEFPLWGVVSLPWVSDNPEAISRALLEMLDTDPNFANEFEQQGMVPLAFKPLLAEHSGFREPISSLDQLNGMRLRGLGGPVNTAYAALGADMVDVPTPDVFEALQRGTIDGFTQQTFDLTIGNSLHEVAPHVVDAQIGAAFAAGNLMSRQSWDRLPADIQDLILELNNEYPDASRQEIPQLEEGYCDELLEAGGSVTRIADEEIEAWKAEVQEEILNAWVAETAELSGLSEDDVWSFYENYTAAVERYEAQSDYVNGLVACAERS